MTAASGLAIVNAHILSVLEPIGRAEDKLSPALEELQRVGNVVLCLYASGERPLARLRAWIRGFLPYFARVLRLPGMRGLLAPLADIVEQGVLGSTS